MTHLRVMRTDAHIQIGDQWFSTRSLVNAAYDRIVSAGSKNPAFDSPPFFWTGSPYGVQILSLGCETVAAPETYVVHYLPAPSWH